MHIIYSDENDRLTPEIWSMMQQAADKAAVFELGEELAKILDDISAEKGDAEYKKLSYKLAGILAKFLAPLM